MKGMFAIALVACGGNARTVADAGQPLSWSVTCDVTGGPPRADSHPTFELGGSRISGDLERARIVDVLEAAGVAACPTPSSLRTVEVDWFIDPRGAVSNVTAPTDALGRCVSGVVAGLRFPAPKGGGGVMVHFGFQFHPPRAQSFAALGRIESGTVKAAIEAHLPAIADCFAHAPDRLSIDVGEAGTQVDVGAESATGCVARQLASMQPTTMPIACAVTHG